MLTLPLNYVKFATLRFLSRAFDKKAGHRHFYKNNITLPKTLKQNNILKSEKLNKVDFAEN